MARIRTIKPEFPQSESMAASAATPAFVRAALVHLRRSREDSRGLANAREPSLPIRRRRAEPDRWVVERVAARRMRQAVRARRVAILKYLTG